MSYEILFSRHAGHLWMARSEQGSIVEIRVKQGGDRARTGRIVKARVSNVLPGIQSAFLEIGKGQAAFLHASDLPASVDQTSRSPIQDRLREGNELVAQIVREEHGSKRARVTCRLTVPGHMLVLVPGTTRRAVSRRIPERDERARLQGVLDDLQGEDCGWIARTAAVGAEPERVKLESERLLGVWREVRAKAADAPSPSTLLREPDLLAEVLRDSPPRELDAIVFDEPDDRQAAIDYLEPIDPLAASKIRMHSASGSLYEARGFDSEIDRTLRPRVWLKSGGHLVIEETEALVSIDVNTGKYLGKRDVDDTILRTNREAAREIPRQLRLRGLGGIVVVDLIDMTRKESREEILSVLEHELLKDPAKTRVVGISDLGLLQLTRKWSRPGIAHQLTGVCQACRGLGRIRRQEA